MFILRYAKNEIIIPKYANYRLLFYFFVNILKASDM